LEGDEERQSEAQVGNHDVPDLDRGERVAGLDRRSDGGARFGPGEGRGRRCNHSPFLGEISPALMRFREPVVSAKGAPAIVANKGEGLFPPAEIAVQSPRIPKTANKCET